MKAIGCIFSMALVICSALSRSAYAEESTFTYQGRLTAGTTPADGRYEMTFTLYDAALNGNVVASQTVAPVPVTNGLFTATLDFGSGAFTGEARWLEISLNIFGSDTIPTTVTPRQQITATPYAVHAATAGKLVSIANAPLEMEVNGVSALRIEPTIAAPNIIGGSAKNGTSNDVVGAFIGGGGMNDVTNGDRPNRVFASYGAIVGGLGNGVHDQSAFIGGGEDNRIAPGAYTAAIVGGGLNAIELNSYDSFIGGGRYGVIDMDSGWSVLSGGYQNLIGSNSPLSTISGGSGNLIEGNAGRSTIGGGRRNQISDGAFYGVIGGGNENTIQASANAATISGGEENAIFPDASFSVISGGTVNSISSEHGSIGGGNGNWIGPDSDYSTIGGGGGNVARGYGATIGGGGGVYFDGESAGNSAYGRWSTVGGGALNAAVGTNSTVGGGSYNVVRGEAATVPGGYGNNADGAFSFAAGQNASAAHDGSFVWADAAPFQFFSSTNNEFAARASGGVRFLTASNAAVGVQLAAGSGAWSTLSDRNAKENVSSVNGGKILEKLTALPLATWNYKTQEKSVRHMGPMAQDFREAFGLGENDRTIATVDADGVALAAIQGLNEKVETENRELRAELRARDAQLAQLQKQLAHLEQMLRKMPGSKDPIR